jgi:FKBP-type peptidyl-prolyl cis-trans isomerase FkpA
MQKKVFLFLVPVLFLMACQESFKKGDLGLEYKIISEGKGKQLKFGNFMQIHVSQIYNGEEKDTTLSDSREMGLPMIEILDSAMTPMEYYKILIQMKKGDSLVIRTSTDSLMKKMPGGLPPFMKKGNFLLTTVKLLNIFEKKEEADSARQADMLAAQMSEEKRATEQLRKDDRLLNEYFRKNKINPSKGALGTYVQIIQQGNGTMVDTSVVVKTNYTGSTLKGITFDSNTDSAFNHVEPFMVNMTNDMELGQSVIRGWTDGLRLLSEGAKAKFFIPSSLAYGKNGAGDKIGPNEILIFDIEVLDVLSKAEAKLEIESKQKKMMGDQEKIQESLKKAENNK